MIGTVGALKLAGWPLSPGTPKAEHNFTAKVISLTLFQNMKPSPPLLESNLSSKGSVCIRKKQMEGDYDTFLAKWFINIPQEATASNILKLWTLDPS